MIGNPNNTRRLAFARRQRKIQQREAKEKAYLALRSYVATLEDDYGRFGVYWFEPDND